MMPSPALLEVTETLAARIKGMRRGKPLLVAFDGIDCSGKTSYADMVGKRLGEIGVKVLRLSIDRFHNPREVRMARGELSAEGYYRDSFDLRSFIDLALKPAQAGRGRIALGIYDYRKESDDQPGFAEAGQDQVILVDGIFLQRDELRPYWDLSIFIDIPFAEALARALVRDLAYFGSEAEVKRRYQGRYLPAQELYFQECDPRQRAHILIDNLSWSAPRIAPSRPSS